MVELSEISIFYPNLPEYLDGLTILYVSDMHTRRFGPREQQLYQVMQQGCDLLLCSGDACFQFSFTPFELTETFFQTIPSIDFKIFPWNPVTSCSPTTYLFFPASFPVYKYHFTSLSKTGGKTKLHKLPMDGVRNLFNRIKNCRQCK